MPHEPLATGLVILGFLLLLGYYLGPRTEIRKVKRTEGMVMLVPTGALLFLMATVIFSGILG
ncbi:MAG: hypothetical protein HXY34_08895 [Candidatus Thorarchaeota archaeon]|nr:hypothetical protein [Candidatus Thorarchaeota archaeon]